MALAKGLLAQIAALAGTPQEILTVTEIATIRQIGRDYEGDF